MKKIEPAFKIIANIFTIAGVLLTIYFSIFYVPGYIREYQNEKIKNINKNLIETLQEIVYNKEELTVHEIETFIKGKEIKNNIEYPYTIDELLIQTQDAFVDNTFIPLKDRKRIICQIDSIRSRLVLSNDSIILVSNASTKKDTKFINNEFLSYLAGFLGLIISTLGAYSIYLRARKDRKEAINQEIEQSTEKIENKIKSNLSYEEFIKDIFQELKLDFYKFTPDDRGADFKINLKSGKSVLVEVKYSLAEHTPPTVLLNRFSRLVKEKDCYGLYITNFRDTRAKIFFRKHNEIYKQNQVGFINGFYKEDLKKAIKEVLESFQQIK